MLKSKQTTKLFRFRPGSALMPITCSTGSRLLWKPRSGNCACTRKEPTEWLFDNKNNLLFLCQNVFRFFFRETLPKRKFIQLYGEYERQDVFSVGNGTRLFWRMTLHKEFTWYIRSIYISCTRNIRDVWWFGKIRWIFFVLEPGD